MKAMRVGALAILSAILVLSPPLAQAQTAPAGTPLGNFGRINEGYYRGAQPTGRQYAELAALGIKSVLNLRDDVDPAEPSAVQSLGMRYYGIPLTNASPPSPEAVNHFLNLVNDPANLPVYVHCHNGRHRTGVLTAVYRITHDGWDADQAYAEMKRFQFDKGFAFGRRRPQKDFVYTFYQTFVKAPGR